MEEEQHRASLLGDTPEEGSVTREEEARARHGKAPKPRQGRPPIPEARERGNSTTSLLLNQPAKPLGTESHHPLKTGYPLEEGTPPMEEEAHVGLRGY